MQCKGVEMDCWHTDLKGGVLKNFIKKIYKLYGNYHITDKDFTTLNEFFFFMEKF